MNFTRPFLLGVVLAGATSLSAVLTTSTQAADPITVLPPATQPASTQPIQPITNAPDPSAAVDAYAQAIAAGGDRVALADAYVRRMVDFGVPEMAASQAADLNHAAPDNGLAWAVTSYVESRKGNFNPAIADLTRAAGKAPDDPFIQRTAGQMLAWYDTQADRSQVPPDLRIALVEVQTQLEQRPAFATAYQQARETYGQSTDIITPTTQPSAASSVTVSTPSTYYDQPVTSTYSSPSSTYIADWPAPYYYNNYSYPAYAPGCWWSPGPTWWGGGIVIINNHGHFDHHHSFDHHHDFFGHDSFHGSFTRGFVNNRPQFDRFGTFDRFRTVPRGFSTANSFRFRQPAFNQPGFRSVPMMGPMPQTGTRAPMMRSAPAGGSSFRGHR